MQDRERKYSFDHSLMDQNLPIPIQIFLWKQVSPFIRPKLGKLHEASCMFCQHAPPGHHELKEACKAFEKVLVQNIQFGLKADLTEAIRSISRWRLIQASLPHVMHCMAAVLYNRLKDGNIQILGAVESKLLYTLHWILLDAAEECADADYEKGIYQPSSLYYLFSIPTMSLFVYLFAPVCQSLKESDFQNFRLENGLKLWQAMWEFRAPEATCFTTHCKPKPRHLQARGGYTRKQQQFGDVFVGRKRSQDDTLSHDSMAVPTTATAIFTDLGTSVPSFLPPPGSTSVTVTATITKGAIPPSLPSGSTAAPTSITDDEAAGSWISSPKDTVFPETIPEESSSTEEEHVVIFRLPSLHESDGFLRDPSIYTAETSLFQLAMRKNGTGKSYFKVDQSATVEIKPSHRQPSTLQKISSFLSTSTDKDSLDSSKQASGSSAEAAPSVGDPSDSKKNLGTGSGAAAAAAAAAAAVDLHAATFMDVAVMRCLFISHWQEDGVYWALHYMYNRLRDISEEVANQMQPRRRSNSLPIPKIEISLYQSTDSKRSDNFKDFIDIPDATGASSLDPEDSPPQEPLQPMRRATSEKSKRRTKIADLKAFVETKLLSKSDKALEMCGGEEEVTKTSSLDYHRSLDTADDSRPNSGMSYMFEPTNLVKGKSMPSLSCLLDELQTAGYIGEFHWDRRRFKKFHGANLPMANPIITVTEHTPIPSPDYLRRQGSIDSQLDAISLPSNKPNWNDRKPSLTRSQTDSNITYTGEDIPEAPGSFCYITKEGDIDIQVVLRAVHSAILRDHTCCTLRVLEVILNLIEILMDLGVMKQCLRDEALQTTAAHLTGSNILVGITVPVHSTTSTLPGTSGGEIGGNEGGSSGSGKTAGPSGTNGQGGQNKETASTGSGGGDGSTSGKVGPGMAASTSVPEAEQNATNDTLNGKMVNPHRMIMNVIIRVLKHLGCAHGCGDSHRGPAAEFLRTQSQNILVKLQRASSRQFNSFLRDYVRYQPLTEVLDTFHAYCGFCIDPSSLLSPLNQKRGSSKTSSDILSQGVGYPGTGLGGGNAGMGGGCNTGGIKGIEGQIMASVFKTLVTRLVNSAKEIKLPENIPMYCEIRQLMTYVKEGHVSVFRRVALSALLDTAVRPSKKDTTKVQTTRVIRHMHQSDLEESQEGVAGPSEPPATFSNIEDRTVRKLLFKKRSTSSTCASLLETEGEDLKSSQSPLSNLRKKHHILTPRHSEKTFAFAESFGSSKSRRSKLGGLVNWFRSSDMTTSESTQESLETLTETASFIRQQYRQKQEEERARAGMHTFQKAKRRVEDRFNKFVLKKGKKKDGSMEESPGSYLYRRNSTDLGESSRESEFVVFKERKLVSTLPVFNGMLRLSFLLETCAPGSVPEANILAASLDLPNSAVVSRAALLLECAHFVHCCNKGQWPMWMKLSFPMFRPSGPGLAAKLGSHHHPAGLGMGGAGPAAGLRRTHMMQRAAGKMFYQWAEAIGNRLEEITNDDKQLEAPITSMVLDDQCQKELILHDEEEDYLDESSIHLYGSSCPMPLRLIACALLAEITSFLRETYQSLPKASARAAAAAAAAAAVAASGSATRGGGGERLPMAGPGPGPSGSGGDRSGGTGPTGGGGGASGTVDTRTPWEKLYSREAANRRWSMALSSMGHSQASAQSLQSIAGDSREAGQTERKISFVLHEPDESEGSSGHGSALCQTGGSTAITMQSDEGKRLPQPRPYLLRRGTGAVPGGSFKRRSLKLRRGTKEGKDMESDWKLSETVKRTDSIQSKRKVSSISDRSDTSEPGAASGEESPGVLSDEQPPESPSDSNDTDDTAKNMPWLKVMVQVANSMYFFCPHHNFCHPFCYRRIMRGSSRLIKSVRKIYGEEFGVQESKFMTEEDDSKIRKANKKEKGQGRKVSDQVTLQTSPIRRKDSLGKKDRIDKNIDLSQIGKAGSVKDSAKDITELEKTVNKTTPQEKHVEPPPILKYIKTQVKNSFHCPFATLLKGAVILNEDQFLDVMPVAWELLLESNQEVAASAASIFILAAVKVPAAVSELMQRQLSHSDVHIRINSVLRFQVLWKLRYQVWPRMEEGAHLVFKVPPPGIEFTLPSPKIGIESLDVVDSPWELLVKTKVEEVTINQERHRSLVTATKTRKKQQTELIRMALQAQDDKKREERENFLITTIPITVQAAYEPSLYHTGEEHEEDDEQDGGQPRNAGHHLHSAHSLFPSCLCSAVIQIINLLDDAAVSADGNAVYEVAYQVIWCCLVEDSALFLRYILERLTRDKQDQMFKILRHLIRFIPKLPQQAAFALYNYIIGYVMFYVRSPHEEGQKLIGTALSLLWMVVHSVHGIMFKDLKQILRKEQCDASILLTANVPSAKKIIVHGPQDPDAGGIPSQFPVQEDTQFCQILRESLDFFGIAEGKQKEYFLVDHKTHQIRNPTAYVRDFYFFKRSQYPQLELVYLKPDEAFNALQQQELGHKFVEIGKVLLTWAILKNVDMVVQRVVFLHEELMKLPAFPRKALECDLDLYRGGEIGKMLLGLDVLHKFMWVRLIARMFEAMAGNFAYSGDIHLFLNVLNGAVILHSEDACILRYVMATYINAAFHFKNIFSTNGYLLIMPTLLKIYSNHPTNKLVCTTVEYAVKQFYLMNRKPFILQMFGSVSAMLDTDEEGTYGDAHKIQSSCLFNLLLSLETPSPDPLNIAELVKEDKPLKPIDFCYHDEYEMVTILDCISLCVMVVSYSSESTRGYQMLIILEAILPCYVQYIHLPTYNKEGKSEKEIINQLAVAVRTLVNNCEALTKSYNGPYRSSPEHKGSSQRNYSSRPGGGGPYSPAGYDYDDESAAGGLATSQSMGLGTAVIFSVGGVGGGSGRTTTLAGLEHDIEDSELLRAEYRRPRDVLLSLVGDFMVSASSRLSDLARRNNMNDGKTIELLDVRSHIRLADIAHTLLKVSPYDPESMACRGLQNYMSFILPSTEWANDAMRPALVTILRRLDKVFQKISKKASIRRNVDWDAAAGLLKGIYDTMMRYPYIMHWQHVKGLINTCQSLIVSDIGLGGAGAEGLSSAQAALMAQAPPPHFCSMVVRLIALQILNTQDMYTLEQVCGGSSILPTQEKSENMIMNLIMPLCLRVGTGRKDVQQMRQSDISFALILVLHSMSPPNIKGTTSTATNIKTATEMRTGSLTFTGTRDTKASTRINTSLYQVSFLALKMMTVCFEGELISEWSRIARAIRELGKRNEAATFLWDFLDFVVTHRTPLFILMQPFIFQKLAQPPISDFERTYHAKIRDKIRGIVRPPYKSRGALLMELAHEMKELKEELEDTSSEDSSGAGAGGVDPVKKHSADDKPTVHLTSEVAGHGRHQRPSLIDFLTGGGGAAKAPTVGEQEKLLLSSQHLHKESSSSASFVSNQMNPSISETNETVGQRDQNVNDRSQRSSASDDQPNPLLTKSESTGSHPHQFQQRAQKLRFVSSVEFKHSSGETSTTPLSPGSPADESSGESHSNKSKLQRIKPQSRKTFRIRKSRKHRIEVTPVSIVSTPTIDTLDASATERSPTFSLPSPTMPKSPTLRFTSSDGASRTGFDFDDLDADLTPTAETIDAFPEAARASTSVGAGQLLSVVTDINQMDPHRLRIATRGKQQNDGSYDEDSAISQTSSTSGYRESYPLMHLMDPPESSPKATSSSSPQQTRLHFPPLASPDLHDLPSTSSAATTSNFPQCDDASSPDVSLNDNGFFTAQPYDSNQALSATDLICSTAVSSHEMLSHLDSDDDDDDDRYPDGTSSAQSLVTAYDTQDETTLI